MLRPGLGCIGSVAKLHTHSQDAHTPPLLWGDPSLHPSLHLLVMSLLPVRVTDWSKFKMERLITDPSSYDITVNTPQHRGRQEVLQLI